MASDEKFDSAGFDGVIDGAPRIVQPKMQQYGHSYASMGSRAGGPGNQQSAHRVSVQSLPGQSKPAQNTVVGGAAAADEPSKEKAKQAAGTGIVKSVPSGDTVIIQLPAARGQIGAEKAVTLSGITAPRIGRGKNGQDEPFAHASKEFLRKLVIGKQVAYQVNFESKNGRAYGQVKTRDGLNLTTEVVKAGWAKVQPGNARKDGTLHPERQEMVDLAGQAESDKLGIFSADVRAKDQVRQVDWNPDVNELINKFKNKPLRCIIDRVLDGSKLRIEVLNASDAKLHHLMLNLQLAGVQCPRIPPPDRDNAAPEPFALAAREFVEQRVLNRDMDFLLQGVDKSNTVYGTLLHPRGNMSVELLRNGLAKFVKWSSVMTADAPVMEAAQSEAQQRRLNIWRNYAAPAVGNVAVDGTIRSEHFNAVVVQVISGDCLVVEDVTGARRQVQLASISAPRMGRSDPEDWAIEAREELRKMLIRKKVNVAVDYVRDPPETAKSREKRSFVSVTVGKNRLVGLHMVSRGLAKVIRHRQDEERSVHYDALVEAEQKAAAQGLGMHSKSPAKKHHITDLTDNHRPKPNADPEEKRKAENQARTQSAKAKQFLPFLEKKRLAGIVEYVFSGTRLKVHVPSQTLMISSVLAGIRCPKSSSKTGKGEPFGDQALAFVQAHTLQQDVRIEVEALDKGDNFISTIFVGPTKSDNLAVLLLEEGLATVFRSSAERSVYKDQLFAAEEAAKAKRKNIWENYDPAVEAAKLAAESKEAEAKDIEFDADKNSVTVEVTEVISVSQFYIKILGAQGTDIVEEYMRNFGESQAAKSAPPAELKRGTVCAGQYLDGSWHRVKIETRASDDAYNVIFMDFGNTDTLEKSMLREITDERVRRVEALARLSTLAGLKGPHTDSDVFDASRIAFGELVVEKDVLGKIHMRDSAFRHHVSLFIQDSPDSVNVQLLKQGLARILKKPMRQLTDIVKEMRPIEAEAIDKRVGLWRYGNVSDPEEEDDDRLGNLVPRKH